MGIGFEAEQAALERALAALASENPEACAQALGHLAKEYARLLRKARRLVSLGDRMEDELRRLAAVDCLTGLSARRSFMEVATREAERAARTQRPLSTLVLDVDHFKSINDSYGHDVGDEALRRLAEALRACLRAEDAVGRLGGEEFAVVLPDTAPEEALAVAERLREATEAVRVPLPSPAGGAIAFTISIGVYGDPLGRPRVEEMLSKADAALYQAKREGRNRCRLHSPEAGSGLEPPMEPDPELGR